VTNDKIFRFLLTTSKSYITKMKQTLEHQHLTSIIVVCLYLHIKWSNLTKSHANIRQKSMGNNISMLELYKPNGCYLTTNVQTVRKTWDDFICLVEKSCKDSLLFYFAITTSTFPASACLTEDVNSDKLEVIPQINRKPHSNECKHARA